MPREEELEGRGGGDDHNRPCIGEGEEGEEDEEEEGDECGVRRWGRGIVFLLQVYYCGM